MGWIRCAQTACGPGSGEEKAPCVLLQPRDAWAWLALLALPRLERAAAHCGRQAGHQQGALEEGFMEEVGLELRFVVWTSER